MKKLIDAYSEIQHGYYDIPINAKKMFENDSKTGCRQLIKDFFIHGDKEKAFDVNFNDLFIDKGKHEHTVSLYLMGRYVSSLFESKIQDQILQIVDREWNYEFDYTWYLASLYHDTSSCVECKKLTGDLEIDLKQSYDVEFTSFEYFKEKGLADACRYSVETIDNYYKYRFERFDVQDHGIIGGFLFFDKLQKNYNRKMKKNKNIDNQRYVDPETDLIWEQKQLGHFALLSDAIISHNIWTCQKGSRDEKCYMEYHLSNLVIDNELVKPLSMQENPLQFMLCLLDTIEPQKRFGELTCTEVFNNVYIEKTETGIKLGVTGEIRKQPGFFNWMNGIRGMESWLAVKVTECKQEYLGDLNLCTISIEII